MIRRARWVALLATVVAVVSRAAAGQTPGVLHIRIVLVDAEGKDAPVARHALLISDNPSTAVPRRVVTSMNGTADVRLPPGNYTVESDQPVAFRGKAYQWTQTLDIVAGRDALLELTADNAEIGAAGATASEADPWLLLAPWRDRVVALWTPTTHASGFVIDAKGLVVTSQRALGAAPAVEVQVTTTVKVTGKILVADPVRDVDVLWVDPTVVALARPVPLGCTPQTQPSVVDGQKVFAIEAPLFGQKDTTPGTVSQLGTHAFVSDLALSSGGAGGPVFTAEGRVAGITSFVAERNAQSKENSRVVRIGDVCEVVATAEQKLKGAASPAATRLPVEPDRPFPVEALENATQMRTGLAPYQVSSSDFDVAFMTPVQTYRAQHQAEKSSRDRGRGAPPTDAGPAIMRTLTEFGDWSRYVAEFPPVLLVRVTPKMVEGFWAKVARGAAQTQGMALPPLMRIKSGFSRMRAFCGDAEVTPIHPFKLEQQVSESGAIYEGLYVFDPGALAPSCGPVKLVVYSEKEPDKGDTLVVNPNVVQQIWQDFAPYRAAK